MIPKSTETEIPSKLAEVKSNLVVTFLSHFWIHSQILNNSHERDGFLQCCV